MPGDVEREAREVLADHFEREWFDANARNLRDGHRRPDLDVCIKAMLAFAEQRVAALTASRSSNDEIVEVLEPFANLEPVIGVEACYHLIRDEDIYRARDLLSKVKEQG